MDRGEWYRHLRQCERSEYHRNRFTDRHYRAALDREQRDLWHYLGRCEHPIASIRTTRSPMQGRIKASVFLSHRIWSPCRPPASSHQRLEHGPPSVGAAASPTRIARPRRSADWRSVSTCSVGRSTMDLARTASPRTMCAILVFTDRQSDRQCRPGPIPLHRQWHGHHGR